MLSQAALLAALEEAAPSRAEIARVINVAPARITELYKGERKLSLEEARALVHHFGIENAPEQVSIDDLALEHGIAFVEEVDLALGMGGGAFADMAESKGMVPFKSDWLRGIHTGPAESLRVVRGAGDSMQPTILDGDTVLIDTAQRSVFDQDRIWAVFWGDLGMIKRVRRMPSGNYLLMSDNQTIRPIEAADDEMHVLGRVIWIGRRI